MKKLGVNQYENIRFVDSQQYWDKRNLSFPLGSWQIPITSASLVANDKIQF
jgi:hypothetical protein